MATAQVSERMAEQIGVLICEAREHLADALEEYLKSKKVDIGVINVNDKLNIERLFTETVNSYIIAEIAAMVSYLIYDELKNDDILKSTVPTMLQQYESMFERIPDNMVNKTSDLPDLAKRVLESETEKDEIVKFLLRDIGTMSRGNYLKASFDAAVLNFLGE